MIDLTPRSVDDFTDTEIKQLRRIHSSILSRCFCRSDTSYPYYGGRTDRRPVGVGPEWRGKGGFQNFLIWCSDHGWRPGCNLQIDRIEDQDYGPTTCRIISRSQNCRNRRSCRMISINGIELTQIEWAEIIGTSDRVLLAVRHRGGSEEEYIRQRLLAPGRKGRRRTGIYPI